MRERLVAWLACPTCRAGLTLTATSRLGEDIREGALACSGCGTVYPITRGIPRMVPGGVTHEARETAQRFGYEWTRFGEIRPQYAAQFQGWLAPLLTAEGLLVAWLYAREGNGRLLALLEPLRRLTRTAPLAPVSALAWGLTVPVWLSLRTVYAAARAWVPLRRCLPYSSYLVDLVPFPFREVHSIVFDQLLAPVAHYMSRIEVERCFVQSGLALTSLRWHHANSWSAAGRARPSGREPIAAGS